ncbi:MAG: ABC transporter substrate-binding protein, partial [Candidatus Sericytochromatia bacterium]
MLRRFSTFALPLAAILSLTACAGGAPAGKVLRVGLQDEFKTLDPAIGYDVPSWGAEHLIYNGLVTYDFESKVAPDLAESWQVEGDGKAFVFQLRQGLKFHDGRPVTAKDVVYSF